MLGFYEMLFSASIEMIRRSQSLGLFMYCFALIGRQTLSHPLSPWFDPEIIVEGLDGVLLNSVCKDFVDSLCVSVHQGDWFIIFCV